MKLQIPKIKPAELIHSIKLFLIESVYLSRFFVLLGVVLTTQLVGTFSFVLVWLPFLKPLVASADKIVKKVISFLDMHPKDNISSTDLIILALSHLKMKKSRSFITIGGMAVGFGSIIFLLSLGYGFEKLVISRITTLGEMKQIDISTGQASAVVFNDKMLAEILKIESVETVLPMVSTVSKVSFNNSVSDVVSYAVTSRYLQESAIQPIRGEIFENEELELSLEETTDELVDSQQDTDNGEVAGTTAQVVDAISIGRERYKIKYAIYPLVWKKVYESPSEDSKVIGYTQRIVGDQQATEVWGEAYDTADKSNVVQDTLGNTFVPWIQDSFPLWQKEACSLEDSGCSQKQYVVIKQGSNQAVQNGFITQDDTTIERFEVISLSRPVFQEGKVIQELQFSGKDSAWIALHSQPKSGSKILQKYTNLVSDALVTGELVFGEAYSGEHGFVGENENGKRLGLWIKASFPSWYQLDCGSECENYFLKDVQEDETQEVITAYIKVKDIKPQADLPTFRVGQVLGDTTEATESSNSGEKLGIMSDISRVATQSSILTSDVFGLEEEDDLEWVMISSQSATSSIKKDILPFSQNAKKLALVNQSMLNLLGIQAAEAVGQEFEATFVFDGKLFDKPDYLAETEPVKLTIIGVLPDEKTPAFYLPFNDMKGIGIKNYSQVKVILSDQDRSGEVRGVIESLGFKTSSVLDTVQRINDLFTNLRFGLLVFGLVALGVAALGMFNTLTVSLLEKTREVGLMKAIGMQSSEIKWLFLAESVIMGFSGGVFGLLFGYILGQLVSFGLTSFALARGFDAISVTHIPISLVVSIMIASFVIGVLTGLYPAYRATKISALNALRYE